MKPNPPVARLVTEKASSWLPSLCYASTPIRFDNAWYDKYDKYDKRDKRDKPDYGRLVMAGVDVLVLEQATLGPSDIITSSVDLSPGRVLELTLF
jgi:hypothetical protein